MKAKSGQARSQGLHVVCPYYTMFPIEFPQRQLKRASRGTWVLDPFCGRGTTLFAARLAGLPCVGIDSSPVAAAIAEAKLAWALPSDVVAELEHLLLNEPGPQEVPSGEFWELCFHPDTLQALCKVREALLRDCSTAPRKLLRVLLLGRLHGPLRKGEPTYLSNQMPRTYASKPKYAVAFWKRNALTPPQVDLVTFVSRLAGRYFAEIPPQVEGQVYHGDARTAPLLDLGGLYSWTITSPPYYGMRTYIPDQWLRNWFLGGPATVAYEFSGQLSHKSPETFSKELASVWSRIAEASMPGARLVIRFGGLRDRRASPRELLLESLRLSGRWRLQTIVHAGVPTRASRQASQFSLGELGQPVEEEDYHAVVMG